MDESEVNGTGADGAESVAGKVTARAEVSDRSLQIRIAGVLQLLIGLASAAITLLILLIPRIVPQTSSPETAKGLAFTFACYGVVALFFIVTGIETIRLRQWVRPVILSLMWPCLIMGVYALIFFIFIIPNLKNSMESGGATGSIGAIAISCMFAVAVVVYILIPLSLIGLFHGEHVRRYLECRNPRPSWVDAVPLPVFGLSLWYLLLSLGSLVVLATLGIPYLVLFGKVFTGPFLVIYALIYIIVFAVQAYGLYKLKPWSWWLTLALSIVFSAAAMVNAINPPDATALSGSAELSSAQIKTTVAMMQSTKIPSLSMMIFSSILFIGFMLYIRRFFISNGTASKANTMNSFNSKP